MKKVLFCGLISTFVLLSLSSCSSDSSDISSQSTLYNKDGGDPGNPGKGVHAGARWTIGRKSKGCERIGFCTYVTTVIGNGSVTIDVDKNVKKVVTFIQTGQIPKSNTTNNVLRCDFANKENYEYAVELFSGNDIILEEDFSFDTSDLIKEGMNIVKNFTIPAGKYPITYNDATGLYGFTIISSTRD